MKGGVSLIYTTYHSWRIFMYEEYYEKLKEECLIRNRSPRTADVYIRSISTFMRWTGNKSMGSLTLEDARNFIIEKRKSGVKASTCNGYNAAICFLYKHILHIPWDPQTVPRMKLDSQLPGVLTLEEIKMLIDTAKEIRNKAIIALLYSSGLRVGELVNLRAEDIYVSTMQVHIREGKNHSDHWTLLSNTAKDLLIEYWKSYPVSRDQFFVSLDNPHDPLKVSGVEIMVRSVAKQAGLKVHPHMLRHSFATHLLEQGVPLQYIQAMLGHKSFMSTHVYIHVSNKTVMGIRSPLDPAQKKKRGRRPGKKDGDKNE